MTITEAAEKWPDETGGERVCLKQVEVKSRLGYSYTFTCTRKQGHEGECCAYGVDPIMAWDPSTKRVVWEAE